MKFVFITLFLNSLKGSTIIDGSILIPKLIPLILCKKIRRESATLDSDSPTEKLWSRQALLLDSKVT